MHRKFIALILVAATLVAGLSARSAHADSEDAARVLAGLAALAILGAVIRDANDDRAATVSRRVPTYHQPNRVRPRPLPPRVTRYDLPASCLIDDPTRRGKGKILAQGCLNRSFRHSDKLPGACKVRLWDGRKMRRGYAPQCLKQQGYRITRN